MAATTSPQTKLLGRNSPQSLLVVRLGAMGDVIHTLAAVATLRRTLPDALIGWIIEERWAELLCTLQTPRWGARSPGRPLVDRVHTTNIAAWRHALSSPRTWGQIAVSVSDLRGIQYDVAVDFQGAIRSALIARLSQAPVLFGFGRPREKAASMFYTRRAVAEGSHIIEQNLSLASAVAQSALTVAPTDLPRDVRAEERVENLLKQNNLAEYAIVNPGAGWGAKKWPPERYGEVARELAARAGVRSLINFGPGEEKLARDTESASGGAALSLSLTLTELIAATRQARLFLGGDTGPMHLAAALGVPVVGIFGPTDPVRNGPFHTAAIALRSPASPTTHSRRNRVDEAMLGITVEDAVRAATKLLEGHRG